MDENTFDERQYVIFKLGAEVFGLDINKVKEIIVYQETTNIPGSGQLIEGIINLRGSVIPIFNLRRKFGFPEAEKTRSARIVVVEANDSTVGIVVDGVSEVLIIPGSVIEKPSSMISSGVDASYIAGIAKMEEKLVILLNLEKVINREMAEAV
ncbi:MAG: chemotaxis protein CheW [Firmicutes bacterium HGW-Firmicutes-8]|nr:MAG: chemotaxis protein CheW [Firmicutes bacterium HGW-Firmicutes-8]